MLRKLFTLLGINLLVQLTLQGTPIAAPGKNTLNQTVDINSCETADCGNCNEFTWFVTQDGWVLSKITLIPVTNKSSLKGVILHYTNALGATLDSTLIGSNQETPLIYIITKQVIGITMRQQGPNSPNNKQPLSGFVLHYSDSTTQNIGYPNFGQLAYYSSLETGLLGLRCSFHQKPHGQSQDFDPSYGCIPYSIPCATLTFDAKTLNNMTVLVDQTGTQDITHALGGWFTECGPRVFVLTPTLAFASIANNILTVSPTLPSSVGTYSMSLKVTMQNYLTVPSVTRLFTITVICTVTTVSFSTPPPISQLVTIGMQSQPVNIPFTAAKTPACIPAVAWTMTPTNLPWLTLSASGDNGNFVINGAVSANKGTYTLTVTATIDGKQVTSTTTLTIACHVSSVDKTGTIANIIYFQGTPTVSIAMPTYTLNPTLGANPLTYSLQMQAGGTVPSAFSINTTTMKFQITQGIAISNGVYNLKIVATENLCSSGAKFNDAQVWTVTVKCTTAINVMTNPIPATITFILDPNQLNSMTQTIPTYAQTPSACQYNPSYSVKNVATGACVAWLTCNPTANIIIATTDWSLAGTYNFRIDVTDSLSDVTNSSVTFTVIVKIRNASSITMSTTPAAQTYQVNSATLIVNLPTYTWYPTQSATVFSYAITAGPNFVTISGSPAKIQIFTSVPSNVGTYSVSVTATETNSGLQDTRSFNLLVTCVSAISPSSALADVVYFITDPAITRVPTYSLSPANCLNELVLTVTNSDGSPLPATISYSAPNILIQTSDYAASNVFTVKVVAIDPKTGITNTSLSFKVTIKCTKSLNLVQGAVTNFTYQIRLSSPFNMIVPLPQYQVNPIQCASGTLTYEVVSTDAIPFPAFITRYPTTTIELQTQDESKIGNYNFKLKVTEPLTGLINEQNTWVTSVTPATRVTSLTWISATQIADLTYLVSSPANVLDSPQYSYLPSNADTKFTFSLGPSTPTFITLVPQGTGNPKIQVLTSNVAHVGIYSITYTVTEVVSGKLVSDTFVVTVSCVNSISQSSTMAPVVYYINDPEIVSSIPQYTLTPAACPYELQYQATLSDGSPLPNALSLVFIAGKQNIRVFETVPAQAVVYTVRITVIDPKSGIQNFALTQQVTINCTKSLKLVSNTIPLSTFYTVNKSQLLTTTYPVPTYEPLPNNCPLGQLTYQVVLNPVSTPFPTFITQSPTTSIDIGSINPATKGLYKFRVIATDQLTSLQNNEVLFEVTMIAIDDLTLVSTTAITDKVYKINDPAIVLPVPQYSYTPANAKTFFVYKLVSPTPTFVTLTGTDQNATIKIETSNFSDTNAHQVTIEVYEQYSQITKTLSFNLLVTCVRSIATASTINNQIYYIGDPQIRIGIPTYFLTPSGCPVELNYSVLRSDGTSLPNAIKFLDQTNIIIFETDTNAYAIYTVLVQATDKKTLIQSDIMTFKVTIRLRVLGLNIMTGTDVPDLTYRVGSPAVLLTAPQYSMNPPNAQIDPLHELGTTTPTFVTLLSGPSGSAQIQILTSNPSHTGIYKIDIHYTDQFSGLKQTDTFILTVSCIGQITVVNNIAPIIYFITDSPFVVPLPVYQIVPANCPNELYISAVTLQSGASLPNAIRFDGINIIDIYETTYSATGQYSVMVTVTDPKSKIKNTNLVFNVTVKCTKSIDLVSANIPAVNNFEIDEKLLKSLALTQPTFIPNPSQCTIGTYQYQLADLSGNLIPHPGFLTQFDNSSLKISTIDKSFENVYNWSIKVTEPISGLINNSVKFKLELTVKIYALQMNLITNTIIPDQNYLLGSPAMNLLAYQYNFVPSNAVLDVVYSLIDPPAFVSLVNMGGQWVLISTSNPQDTGIYTIKVRTLDKESGLEQTQSFKLTVSCVRQIDSTGPLADVTYWITDPAIERLPTFNLTPAGCPNELVYQVTQQDGSPLPSSIAFFNTGPRIAVFETNYALTAVYQVKVLVTDPKTGLQNSDYSFKVTVKCTKTIEIVANAVNDFSYQIDLDQPWTKNELVPTYAPNPAQCAVGTYSLQVIYTDAATFPPFINQVPTDKLIVATQDVTKVGAHNFKIKASEPISGLINENEVFVLTILKPIYTEQLVLISGTELNDLLYFLGSPKVVLNVPQYTILPVNADRKLVYSLDPSTPAFITFLPWFGKLEIASSNNADLGVYTITVILKEEFSGVTVTESFILTMACVKSIFQYNVLAPVVYYIRDPDILVPIPAYSIEPNTCPNELVYSAALDDGSPLPNAISLLNQNGTQNLRLSETDPALTGFYTVRIKVVDPKSGSFNSNLTVQVIVKCTKSITILTDEIPDISRLNEIDPAKTYTNSMPTYDIVPNFCLRELLLLQILYVGVPVGTPVPSWLTYDQANVVMNVSDALGVKAYNFQVKALETRSGLVDTQVAFKVVSANGPFATQITIIPMTLISDQEYLIGEEPILIEAPRYDKFPSYVDVEYMYDFVTPYPFIEVVYDSVQGPLVKISSTNPLDYGLYEIELRATESFSGLTSTTTFKVQVNCVRSITPTTQVSDLTYFISDNKAFIQLPIIELQPQLCPRKLVYSLKMQDDSLLPSSIELVPTFNAEQVSVFETEWLKTGIFPIQVTMTDFTTLVTADIQFTITIKCTKQLSVANNPLTPVLYNVGTDSLEILEFDLPTYEPSPAQCAKGLISYELLFLNDQTVAFPDFISQYPQQKIVVATQQVTYLGSNNFKLVATDPLTGLKNDSLTQDVELYCKTLNLVAPSGLFEGNDISYSPGYEGVKNILLPPYGFIPERCKEIYQVEILPSFRNLQATSTVLPKWIWLSDDQQSFNIWSLDKSLTGKHAFKLRTTIEKYNIVNQELKFTISFDCPITEIIAFPLPPDSIYYIDPTQPNVSFIQLPQFSWVPDICSAELMLSVVTNSITVSAQDFSQIDSASNKLILSSTNLDIMGSYVMKIQALELRRGMSRNITFNLTIDCKVTKLFIENEDLTETEFKYIVGTSPQEFAIPVYKTLPEGCIKPIKYTLFIKEIDGVRVNNNQALPSFISLDAARGVIKLYGNNFYEAQKVYTFFLTALEPKSKIGDKNPYTFTVQVIGKQQPPQFSKPLDDIVLSQSTLQSASTLEYKLPAITGGKVAGILAQMGKAAPFLSFNQDTMLFEVTTSVALKTSPQIFPVTVTLQDEFGATTTNSFNAILFPEKLQDKKESLPSDIIRNEDPNDDVDKDDFIDVTPFKDEHHLDEIWGNKDAKGFAMKTGMTAKISKVQMDGYFQVNWSHEIYSIRKESIVNKNAVQVRVIWMNEAILTQQEPKPTYRTRIEDINERFISFQLLFDDPDLISRGVQLDIVEVNFSNPAFFVRVSDNALLEPNSRILIQEIPRQVAESDWTFKQTKKAQSTAKTAQGLAVTSMASGAMSGVSAATVWGLFNTIQLISMQAYTGSEMPSNAANVFKTIDEFFRGGPLNPAKFWNKLMSSKMESTVPVLNRRLEEIKGPTIPQTVQTMVSTQFVPKNPIIETGFFVMIIFISIMVSVSLAIFTEFSNQFGKCGLLFSQYLLGPLQKIFMMNLMIQAQQFGYLYFVLSGIKQKVFEQYLIDAGSSKQVVNSTLYYLVFAYVTIYPISVCLFLFMAGASGLKNKTIKAHLGSLYSGLDINNPINAQFVTLFLLRRLIVGVTIAFFRTYYFVQLEILMVSSLVCLCFIVLFKPYKTWLNNTVEMLNECFVILTVYMMHGFSWFIPSRQVRYDIGWGYICVVGIVFLLNLAVIIQKVVLYVLMKLKEFKAQRQLKQQKNVLSNLFSWKPKSMAQRLKRKISENAVVPLSSIETQINEKKPTNKNELHVIDELEGESFDESQLNMGYHQNDSKANQSLYRKVSAFEQFTDYDGSPDRKLITELSIFEASHDDSSVESCFTRPHSAETNQQKTPRQMKISQVDPTFKRSDTAWHNAHLPQSRNKDTSTLETKLKSNLMSELEGFVSSELSHETDSKQTHQTQKTRQTRQTQPQEKSKRQQTTSSAFNIMKNLVDIDNEDSASRVEMPLGDWDFDSRQPAGQKKAATQQEKKIGLKFKSQEDNFSEDMDRLEREILTPATERDLYQLEDFRNQNDAQIVFEKKKESNTNSPFRGLQSRRRSQETFDDNNTQKLRHAHTRNFDEQQTQLRVERKEPDAIRKTEDDLKRSKTYFGQRAPKVSKIGTLLRQVTRFTENLDTMEKELKDAQRQ